MLFLYLTLIPPFKYVTKLGDQGLSPWCSVKGNHVEQGQALLAPTSRQPPLHFPWEMLLLLEGEVAGITSKSQVNPSLAL